MKLLRGGWTRHATPKDKKWLCHGQMASAIITDNGNNSDITLDSTMIMNVTAIQTNTIVQNAIL